MYDKHTIGARLNSDATKSPCLLFGRPEDIRGMLRFPVLVVNDAGTWLAIGHADWRVSWGAPELATSPIPTLARVPIELAAHRLVGEWRSRLAAERQRREALAVQKANLDHMHKRRAALDAEIAGLEAAIAKAESDL